jgi:hypothetical protein
MALGIAINYTPPGTDLDLTLAVVREPRLLVEAIKAAIAEADRRARSESDPAAVCGYRTQRDFLRKSLEDLTLEWATMMLKPKTGVCASGPPASASAWIQ